MPLELRPGPSSKEMMTHLLGVEVAVAVAVGDGDDVEVLMGAALGGGQPLQGPVQLTLAGALGLEEREKMKLLNRRQEGQENQGWGGGGHFRTEDLQRESKPRGQGQGPVR